MSEKHDDEKKQLVPTEPPIVDGFDGFTDEVEGADDDERPVSGRIIQGTLIKFTNDYTWVTRDGEKVSPGLELVAVDIIRVVQKWENKRPVGTPRILGPGEKIPDIKALNEACPKSEWGTDPNGKPQGPYQLQYVLYLINLATMDRYTYPTNTTGGGICAHDFVDKVKLMRQFRGEHVFAVLTLSDIFMNTRFGGRQRPHLLIKRWVRMGGDNRPAPPVPHPTIEATAEPAKTEPLPEMQTVTEPTLAEQMGDDEVPFNDSPDPNVPVAKPMAPAPAPSPRHDRK
jgi:hypothetical protein